MTSLGKYHGFYEGQPFQTDCEQVPGLREAVHDKIRNFPHQKRELGQGYATIEVRVGETSYTVILRITSREIGFVISYQCPEQEQALKEHLEEIKRVFIDPKGKGGRRGK